MKILARLTGTVFLCNMVLLSSTYAQFQVNGTGNYMVPVEPFTAGLWGGGATLRYFVNPHVAVGINGRHFGNSTNLNFGTEAYSGKTNITMLTGQVEYFVTQTKLQPYLGVETGHYSYAYKDLSMISGVSASYTSNNFTVVPKVGLQYKITSALGFHIDASYCSIVGGNKPFDSVLIGGGGLFRFGHW